MAGEPGTGTESGKRQEQVAKPTGNGEVVPKEKEKASKGKETEKMTSRPRSPTSHQEFDTAVNRGWPSLFMLFQPGEPASSIWDNKEAKDEKVRYSI